MASLRKQLAEAVLAHIQAGSGYTINFAGETAWRPQHDLQELLTARVIATPAAVTIENHTRSHRIYEYQIDVGVQRVVEGAVTTDQLDSFTDELLDRVAHTSFDVTDPITASALRLRWVRARLEPIHSILTFDEYNVYQSVAAHSFVTLR